MAERAPRVVIAFHSAKGRTAALAMAVAEGAEAGGASVTVVPVDRIDDDGWRTLADADAIIFGCPTHMGSVSGAMKAFMDASSERAWFTQSWKDKLAAGFTNSASLSGDKLNTLVQLSVFAAQHSMVWVSLGLMPGNRRGRGSEPSALNRLGSHLGAMAQSDPGAPPTEAPPKSDRATGRSLGERVARHAARWIGAPIAEASLAVHPAARHWVLPPDDRPPPPEGVQRTNLRQLAARPGRFEHHLMVVGSVGPAQLECVTASEPLPFAHRNISDEYALALRTGDSLLDPLRFLTLLTDPATGEDVGRIKHGLEDLVLHPHGLLHWPGRLRPPHEPYRFGPGTRRCGLSFVFCGREPIEPTDRPLFVSEGRDADVKGYGDADPPFLLAALESEGDRVLGRIGDVTMEQRRGGELAPEQGGFALILSGDGPHHEGDLLRLAPGATLTLGDARALLIAGPMAPDPPPASWTELPPAPFAPFEDAPPGELPLARDGIGVTGEGEQVRLRVGDGDALVPRYWLARFLFRVALHGYRLGYVETYGGFYYDDREPDAFRFGLRGGESICLDRPATEALVEQLYRAVAPAGYVERLD